MGVLYVVGGVVYVVGGVLSRIDGVLSQGLLGSGDRYWTRGLISRITRTASLYVCMFEAFILIFPVNSSVTLIHNISQSTQSI